MKKQKLLLLMPGLGSGGAQRVMVHLFNHLSRNKYEVHLAVLQIRDVRLDNFNEDIRFFHNINVARIRFSYFKLIKFIKTLQPDVVLTAMPDLNIIISLIKPFIPSNIKYIMRETSIPSRRLKKIPDFLYNYFYHKLISKNHKIICQGNAMASDLINNFNVSPDKICIINNPLDYDKINQTESKEKSFDVILVAGLRPDKGIHRLIEAAKLLNSQISIGILGDGSLKNELQQQIKDLDLNNIQLLGFQKNPISFMRNAKLLVQTSLYEGFPNVLLESIAVGTPVVAFDVPGGTSEIIADGINGFLVKDGDIEGFAEKIKIGLSSNWNHDLIRKNAYDKYNLDFIINKYERCIDESITNEH